MKPSYAGLGVSSNDSIMCTRLLGGFFTFPALPELFLHLRELGLLFGRQNRLNLRLGRCVDFLRFGYLLVLAQ